MVLTWTQIQPVLPDSYLGVTGLISLFSLSVRTSGSLTERPETEHNKWPDYSVKKLHFTFSGVEKKDKYFCV